MLTLLPPCDEAVNRQRPGTAPDKSHETGDVQEVGLIAWRADWAPAAVTAMRLIELNPYGKCTVSIATRRTAAIGMLTTNTKAPDHGQAAE